METARTEFWRGVRSFGPISIGIVPFGVVSGVVMVNTGLSGVEAMAMSVLVFAGSSQLIAAQLISSGAPALVVVLSAGIVNMRFLMYSASMAPYLQALALRWKWSLAYLMTDQAYAIAITHFHQTAASRYKHWYFLGVGSIMWLTWQLATLAGVVLGAGVPTTWSLDFTIPLTFLVLLMPNIKDRAGVAAALTAGVVAVVGAGLPYRLGLLAAALLGVVVGLIVQRRG